MLYESDVIEAVCDYLENLDFEINQKLTQYQRGDDIIASKISPEPVTMFIEAKGETSSKENFARYGKPFTRSQVRNHVAMALFKAAEVLSRNTTSTITLAGVALPLNQDHRDMVSMILSVIERQGIILFWVDHNRNVTVENRRHFLNS